LPGTKLHHNYYRNKRGHRRKFAAQLGILALLLLLMSANGCATTSTLNQRAHERKPLVMAGTRLNLASLRDEPAIADRFGVSPPTFPLLDLPFSTIFDILVLGYTVPVALIRRQQTN